MMTPIALKYTGSAYPDATLTTEHSASSYGQPVLVIEGEAYGPGDVLPNGMVARQWVRLAWSHRRRELRPDTPERLPEPW